MQIRDGVDTYSLPFPMWEGVDDALCVSVLETGEGTVLVGGGHETAADPLVEVATDHGVDAVIVEHGDADHYGGVPALRSALDVEVAVPRGDAEPVEEAGITPDHLLEDGEVWRGVEAIAAPGHTPGNMAFLYDDVLLAGDTVIGSDFVVVADDGWTGPLAISAPSRNTGGDDLAQESVGDLLAYDFEVVLMTHGSDVLEDGHAAMETLVEDLERGVVRHDK